MRRILLIDSEHAFRTVFAEVLRSAGYEVFEAATGEEAAQMAIRERQPMDLVASNLQLSTINGHEAVRRVVSAHPNAAVLYTGDGQRDEMIRRGVLEDGATYLRKPFTAEELLDAAHELLYVTRHSMGGQHA